MPEVVNELSLEAMMPDLTMKMPEELEEQAKLNVKYSSSDYEDLLIRYKDKVKKLKPIC